MHHHIGQRLSFNDFTSTVRFIGQLEDREGEWLGVEWDDDSAGKNDGTYRNFRYFRCRSKSPTAGSFIRPSRPCDAQSNFLEALERKYRSSLEGNEAVEISGKTVEEVGFQRIQQHLSDYQNLQTVSLSRCRIGVGESTRTQQSEEIGNLSLKVQNLELGSNLLESWEDVLAICRNLRNLRVLDLTGNRFLDTATSTDEPEKTNKSPIQINVSQLVLNRTLLCWKQIISAAASCPKLTLLAAASNDLGELLLPLRNNDCLTSVDLAYNCISKVDDISPLATLPHLKTLNLSCNPITGLWPSKRIGKFRALEKLLLTGSKLSSLSSVSAIPTIFPEVTDLVTTGTPLAAIPGARPLTIGHLASIKSLNQSVVSQHERRDAELFYLGSVSKELQSADNQNLKAAILRDHPRFDQLCDQYGQPSIEAPKERTINPKTLDARVAIITFYINRSILRQIHSKKHEDAKVLRQRESDRSVLLEPNSRKATSQKRLSQFPEDADRPSRTEYTGEDPSIPAQPHSIVEKSIHIPLTISIYAVKNLVGRIFDLPTPFPIHIRLIYETGEWDPVRKGEKRTGPDGWDEWSSSSSSGSDDDNDEDSIKPGEQQQQQQQTGQHFRWINGRKSVMRELELPNGTKRIGDWVESRTARIRVEIVGVEQPLAEGNDHANTP